MKRKYVRKYKEAGKLVKKYRKGLGLSINETSKRLKYNSYTCISNIESGLNNVPTNRMLKVCAELHIPLNDMVNAKIRDYKKMLRGEVGL